MALVSQLISLSLRGGVDQKSDRKAVLPGKLLEARNVTFAAPGRLSKRNGFQSLGTRVAGEERHISRARALMTAREELLVADGSRLYAHSESGDEWIDRGSYVPLEVSERPVIRDVYEQTRPDGARHAGTSLELYAWEDSRGGVWWTLLDGEQAVRAPTELASDGSRPKVVCVGDLFCVVYLSGGQLWLQTLAVSAPFEPPSGRHHLTAVTGEYALAMENAVWDATSDQGGLALAYTTDHGAIAVRRWDAANMNALSQTFVPGVLAHSLTIISRPGRGPLVASVVTWSSTMRVSSWAAPDLVTPEVEDEEWVGGGTGTAKLIAGCAVEGATEDVEVFVSSDVGLTRARRPIGPITPVWSWRVDVHLAGKPFVHDGAVYLPTVHNRSSLQPTHFLARPLERRIVAKWTPSTAGGARSTGDHLPESFERGPNCWGMASPVRDRTRTAAGGGEGSITGTQGVLTPSWDFGAEVSRAEIGESLHLSGGFLQQYDGERVVEAGFHLWPEIIAEPTETGNLKEGSYAWCAVYAWTDANGITHRSAPSIPERLDVEEGTGAQITVPPLNLTAKPAITVELYRTIADGSILYRCGPGVVVTPGESLADIVFDEGPADDELQGNLPLYTQPTQLDAPSVLENHPPPAVSALTVHRGRLWAVDSAVPHRVWFSKEVGPGAPPEFSDSTYIHVDPRGGPVTALGSLDTALILFRSNRIHGLAGQGPDSLGQFSDYGDPQLITSDVGCIAERSVATVPQGLVFQSSKGIHLLSRGLEVQPMPDVDEYLAGGVRVRAASLMADSQQVRFVLSSGLILLWDYLVGQWSVWTGLESVDAVVHAGRHHLARPTGAVRRATPGEFSDDGAPIRMRIATSWIQVAGMAGFQRVRRAVVLGEMASPHRLRLSVGYDFEVDPSFIQEITPSPGAAYGEVHDFDEGQPYGGRYPLYAWRAHLARQKCTALQLVLEDVPIDGELHGESMSLSAIALEVGVKRGSYRRPAASTMRRV